MEKEMTDKYRKIIPNSVILAPDDISLLKIQSWLGANQKTLPHHEEYPFSLMRSYLPGEVDEKVHKKVDKLFNTMKNVTLDPDTYTDLSNYFSKHPKETILRLEYSHPLVTDALLKLHAPFDFPESIRKTNTIIPGYIQEIKSYPSEIVLARAPFNSQIALKPFKEPLTLELLTTF